MFMVQGPHFENHSSNPFFCFCNAPLAQESDQIFTTHSPYNTVSPQHEIRGLHNMFPAGVCSHNLIHHVLALRLGSSEANPETGI